ncbi:hypothetical protein [Roseobacter sp. HKCCA0434]|uniref:hypothetical protein n=1 Tax=Roseobacter sp. HKCCA0434 TaxID=3079297 RepID=UPI002905C1BD|nr:hypothetical protein [Roseobacter sp. HKCCA0434]
MSDPALKYVPKEKMVSSSGGKGDVQFSGSEHGIFTSIAYITAWVVAIFGTIGGALAILSGIGSYDGGGIVGAGVATILASWISASGIGVLAEISRKLTIKE